MKLSRGLLIAAAAAAVISTPLVAEEQVDLGVVHKIRAEALQSSQVMEHLFYLTDVSGSRLTNSPGFFNAADWVVKRLGEWGISAHQEKWGPYGRGWTYTRFSAQMLEPQAVPLIGAPLAYTPGTNGPVTGEPMIVAINNEGDFNKYKGMLKAARTAPNGCGPRHACASAGCRAGRPWPGTAGSLRDRRRPPGRWARRRQPAVRARTQQVPLR